jgi:hypothetical protein
MNSRLRLKVMFAATLLRETDPVGKTIRRRGVEQHFGIGSRNHDGIGLARCPEGVGAIRAVRRRMTLCCV